MKTIKKSLALMATALLGAATTLQAGQVNGNITFFGTANLDTGSAATATAVTGWHGNGGLGNPVVADATGDFPGFVTLGVTTANLVAPWSFNSGPVPGFWTAGGFTFDLTQSAISIQGGSPGTVTVNGTGFISGNGFDLTPGVWGFSTQDPSVGTPARFSFSASAAAVPCTGQIGDFVWNDLNGNGCQDAGEPGIPGVTVTLYSGCGLNGTPLATKLTDATGHYVFTGLCPGTYTVGFATPSGYRRTLPNVGCIDTTNPDSSSNQIDSKCACADGTPCGVCVQLTDANPINLNIDCGYVLLPAVICASHTGNVGTPYSSQVVATGGCLPYQNYSIISGSLPPGLNINPTTGVISGVPTTAGTFPYIVQVTDNCGNKANTFGEGCDITITGCPPCAPHDIQYNFNGTQIIFQQTTGGSYIWFIGDGVVTGLPSNHKVVLHISDQTITIPAVGSSPQYVIPVPDTYVTFDPAAVQATTTFDTFNNVWLMTFPPSGMSGNIFYGGAAFKVPFAGLPGGIKNVDWKGTFTTDTAGLTVKWQWHAANYKNFTFDLNAIAPKPTDDNSKSVYKNSDHSGTPEGTDPVSHQPWKSFVIGGGSGGGGGNYTGSGSSTISITPCVCPNP